MENRILEEVTAIQIKHNRKKKWLSVVTCLAAVVVFCTVYALILPAITLEKNPCGIPEHTHGEACFEVSSEEPATKTLICDMDEHTHTDACKKKKEYSDEECNCGKTQHQHMEECYDPTGKLTCELEEHTHSEECLAAESSATEGETASETESQPEQTAEEPDEAQTQDQPQAISEGGISAQSLIEVSNGCGYNTEDGSIYWNASTALEPVTAIEPNTPYIIFGCNQSRMMTDVAYEQDNLQFLKAVAQRGLGDLSPYCRWCFEPTDTTDMYRIYWMGNNNEKKYIKFVTDSTDIAQILLTTEAASASVLQVKTLEKNGINYVTIRYESNGNGFYINADAEDDKYRPTERFMGYHDAYNYAAVSDGSLQRLYTCGLTGAQTAHQVQTADTTNTKINLFDYWTKTKETRDDRDDYMNEGINKNHNLKFYKNGSSYEDYASTCGTMNNLQAQSVINKGMVKNKLENGYPVLSGDPTVTGGSSESLDYLFNPNIEHEGKESHHNVDGLLTENEEGYYYYNSQETMAEYVENRGNIKNKVVIYDKPGVLRGGAGTADSRGQFFPFNRAPEVVLKPATDQVMNHYFGLTITTRFIHQHGGYSDLNAKKPTIFSFSGDDDVWIFIDNVLVADLGGAHDITSVDIDFSTGNIKINHMVDGKRVDTITTLREAYEAAGLADKYKWTGNTYSDNSTHTLKFFYMERGNYDSNLYLKYNLVETPETAIYKVDEWDKPVKDAKFAVYPAAVDETDESVYHMLDKDGNRVNIENPIYDSNCNILDENGNIIVNSLYHGVTDDVGKLSFVDSDGMPYSVRELEEMFGQHFILREVKAPPGYRYVASDVNIEVWQGQEQRILKCANSEISGARAAATLKITATDTLHLRRAYTDGSTSVVYYDENGKVHGTLFAVVFKYTGKRDKDGYMETNGGVFDDKAWTPVYGTDKDGYKTVDTNNNKDIRTAAIEAAKEMNAILEKEWQEAKKNNTTDAKEPDNILFEPSTRGTMQLDMYHLPGHVSEYYRMLPEGIRDRDGKYTVVYFWTDQDSLDTATTDNTYRVDSFPGEGEDGLYYKGFERVFGAKIHIPNLVNDVYIQKMDETGSGDGKLNGANFALYRVKAELRETADGETVEDIYYYTNPSDDNSERVLLNEYEVDPETGIITNGDGKIVNPVEVKETRDFEDGIHKGTARFEKFKIGQYIIKEIKAPKGYQINPTDIKLVSTEDTIYANAGTEEDGVSVGRGPGNLVAPMIQFAAKDQINNTLTWIYSQMSVSKSTLFADVDDPSKIDGYLTFDKSAELSTNEADAARAYMRFETNKTNTIYNYTPNLYRTVENGAQNPTGTRRLFTTVGWPYYDLYQDYDYGLTAKVESAEYENWKGKRLTQLFSRSTYIRVIDTEQNAASIHKVDEWGEKISGAEFAVYAADESYNMLKTKGGAPVDSEALKNSTYDANMNIVDQSGNILAKALYTGATGAEGELIFTNPNTGLIYSLREIENKFGKNFILRETKLPTGYRYVEQDIHIRVWRGKNNRPILLCDNSLNSGARAATTLRITATDTIHLRTPYEIDANNSTQDIEYCKSDGSTFGTLFAVFFRYTGYIDDNGKIVEDALNRDDVWTPVYGNDEKGYTMVDMSGKSLLQAAIESAIKMSEYRDIDSSIIFHPVDGKMRLTVKNIPGHITKYYHLLRDDEKRDARYMVAYYWTDQTDLLKVNDNNCHRVNTTPQIIDGHYYSGFERSFSSDIRIPNNINEVFVQKLDEAGTLLNGAKFALYKVEQQEDGKIKYFQNPDPDANDSTSVYLEDPEKTKGPDDLPEYTIDGVNGVITTYDKAKVKPLMVDVTGNYTKGGHIGTACFSKIPTGQYIIKEVDPPVGYTINTADIMVLVTDDTIYANAGTAGDGVSVGRGPGNLVAPLIPFASEGQIDNTLSWIYGQMRISEDSTSFADVGDESKIRGYLTENHTNKTTGDPEEPAEGSTDPPGESTGEPKVKIPARDYLQYETKEGQAVFSYVPNEARNNDPTTPNPAKTRRLFTTSGWPYYELWQDYDYGKNAKADGANYADLSTRELTHLFSRTTYIRVTDFSDAALTIKKVDSTNTTVGLANAEFRLYRWVDKNAQVTTTGTIIDIDPGNSGDVTSETTVPATQAEEPEGEMVKVYYSRNAKNEVVWTAKVGEALIATTNEKGIANYDFTKLSDGVYYIEEVKAPNGYSVLPEPVKVKLQLATLTFEDLKPTSGYQITDNKAEIEKGTLPIGTSLTFTVTIPNSTGYRLPATGGIGTAPYIFGGLLLCAVGILLMICRFMRRKEDFSPS